MNEDNDKLRFEYKPLDSFGYLKHIKKLSQRDKDGGDAAESWKFQGSEDSENPEVDRLRNVGGYQVGPVELYDPLDKALIIHNRRVGLVSSLILLMTGKKKVFSRLSNLLVQRVEEMNMNGKKYSFSPTTKNGSGYLMCEEDGNIDRVIGVVAMGYKNRFRGLSVGEHGSRPCRFDQINFGRDLELLLKFGSLYLRTCYDRLKKLEKIEEVPKGSISFTL